MMATVSELSMYQAHSIKLSADKEGLEEVVMAASDKLEVCLCLAQCSCLFKSGTGDTTICMEAQQHSSSSIAATQTQVMLACSLTVFCDACLMLKLTLRLGGFVYVTAGCFITSFELHIQASVVCDELLHTSVD